MLVRVRPKRRIFAKRASNSLTRSPYNVPGSTTFTVMLGTPLESGRPSCCWIDVHCGFVLVIVQFAASGAPASLRNVPDTRTSIFGTVYDPRPVYRVRKPVDVLHHGLVGLWAPSAVNAGE